MFSGGQIGSVVIILHAPADPEVNSVDEILDYATQPGEPQSQYMSRGPRRS